jgi:hypothetical protein
VSSIFENIFDADTLERAVVDVLVDWMPTYLREIERQKGMQQGLLPAPRSYTSRNEWATFPEDQLPACIVVSPGLAEPPDADGEGRYRAWWSIGVGVLASAASEADTNKIAKMYGAAIRAIMVQHQSLNGIAHGIEWEDESYDDIPVEQDRTLGAAMLIFRVWVDDIVTRGAGPAFPTLPDPDTQPGSTWPEADTIDVQVASVPLDGEVTNP